MKKIIKQLLSLLTVFFVLIGQFEVPVRAVETEYVGVEVGLEIDDTNGAIVADFDHIDRFNEHGIAIIVKDTYNDKNELVKRYGLINNSGEVVLEPIYTSIIDYDDNYFSVMNYGNNVFEEGIASKRNGSLIVPVKYNYIPNMDGNGVYSLQSSNMIDNQMVWSSDLYSYFDGVIRMADVPEGFVKEDYENLWSRKLYEDVYQISAYKEVITDFGIQYENINWLSNSRGEVIFYTPEVYIQNFYELNNIYYFVANSFNGNMETSSGGLYKLTYTNGEPIVTTLLSPSDYNSVWMDIPNNEVEVYRVTNNQWIKGRYHLETGWVGSDEFGANQKETFAYWGNPKYNMNMECSLKEDSTRYCVHFLSLASDVTNTNLFGEKKYINIMPTSFNEFIIVYDDVTNKSNVFVNKDGNYFFAFEADLDGWLWIDQNYLIRRNDVTIDLKNIVGPINVSDSRFLSYGYNTMIQDIGEDLIRVNDYQNEKAELIDRRLNQSLLVNAEYINDIEIDNGYVTGTYSTRDVNQNIIYKSFIYDLSTRSMVLDVTSQSITSMNEYGYTILSNQLGIKSLVFKSGEIVIPEIDGNRGLEFYFNKGIVVGTSTNKNLYFLTGNIAKAYMDLENVIVSQNAPVYVLDGDNQLYLQNGEQIDTTLYTRLGAFVDGSALVSNETGVYSINALNMFEVMTPVDAVNFVGAFIQRDNSIIYRVNNDYEISTSISSLDSVKQLSEYFYSVKDDSGSLSLYVFNKLENSLTKYDNVSGFAQDTNFTEYFQFNYSLDNLSYRALMTSQGQLINTVNNGSYILEKSYVHRDNGDGTVSWLDYSGFNINQNSDLEKMQGVNRVYENFYTISKLDSSQEAVYFDGVNVKRLGNVSIEGQLQHNQFLRISNYCEGANIDPELDNDDFYANGLVDLQGNVVIDSKDCFYGYNISVEHGIVEPYLKNTSNVGPNPSAGFRDFSGKLIPELDGYGSSGQISISDSGEMRVSRLTDLRRYYDFVNGDGVRVQGYEPVSLQNIYNVNSRKLVYEKDYVNKSGIQDGRFYALAFFSDIRLDSEIPVDQKNSYGGDIYYDKDNNQVRVKYGQVYYNLQNVEVFDQSTYSNVHFDGINFLAEKYDQTKNATLTDLYNEFGERIISGYSYIWKDDELGWYIAGSSKEIPNPFGDDWPFTLNISRIYNSKTLEVLPYYFDNFNVDDLKRDGYVWVTVYPDVTNIENLTYESTKKYGLINRDGTFITEPIFDGYGEVTRTGNALIRKEIRSYQCSYENQDGETITQMCMDFKNGLVNVEKGLILDTDYDSIESTSQTRMNWSTPNFDLDGHVIIVNYVQGEEPDVIFRQVGLSNINGALFEGAVYQYAYYRNGYYYLKKFNENWKVINGSNFDDVIEVVVPRVVEGATVNAIELVGDYVIATQRLYDETFDNMYDYVGVLNRSDMSLFMDFDYSSVKFEDGLFYLELYNTSLGTTQQAVMNEQKEFVVPFNNKYDSISEYVDGYAIGQSGTNEPEVTGANPVVNLLSTFFLDVNAADDDFVLEVIDEDGKVVGDLSEEYESATLLGTVDGVTKALVKKDGKYFIATLVEKPIALIPITGVTLNVQTTTINVGETYNLIGTILPNDANEPVRIEWSSLNTEVASVDANGGVKALKAGTTTITYKVNSFEAVATIIVKSTITDNTPDQDTASAIIETILQKNPNLEKNDQNTVISDVEKLVDLLNGEQNINDNQLIQTIQNVFDLNPNFVSQLNEEEAVAFDQILNQLFEDAFTLDVTNKDIKHQIDGLLLALDILPLLEGYDLTIRLNISDVISKKDEPVLTSYIQEKNYDDEFVYTLDIELIQVLNELETILSELNRPVKLTFALPDRFVGIGELKVIRIHNGVVSELPVTLNPNYTFSFETDQFSSFTLVKASPVAVITDPESSNQTTSGGFNWMFGLVALFVIVAGAVGTLIYKRKVQA